MIFCSCDEAAERGKGSLRAGAVARGWLLRLEADGRDFMMHARIGMLRALNRQVERVFNPDRKDPRWGPRKLARDQRQCRTAR